MLRNDIAKRGWLDSAPSAFTKKEIEALNIVKQHCNIVKIGDDLLRLGLN